MTSGNFVDLRLQEVMKKCDRVREVNSYFCALRAKVIAMTTPSVIVVPTDPPKITTVYPPEVGEILKEINKLHQINLKEALQ